MKISRIVVNNFRSIEKADISTTDFNLFVGQNNSGKTNLFEAVEWFFGSKAELAEIAYRRDSSREILIDIHFSGAQHGVSTMKNQSNQTKISNWIKADDTIVVRRSSIDPKKRQLFVAGQEIKPGTGFDAALNDFLPRFEYVNTRQYHDQVAKYDKKAPVGVMLSGVLAAILENDEQYRRFLSQFQGLFESDDSQIKLEFDRLSTAVKIYLEQQFPDCTKVRFEVYPPVFEDLLKRFETTIDDGVETRADEKGDGMQRALMLSIIQAYADYRRSQEDVGKTFLFFIDEAELHLHPMAQRKLKEVLIGLSQKDDQVFINTHSSVLVAGTHPTQSIFMVVKQDGQSIIEPVSPSDKPYVIYDLLGGSPQDLLLPRNFLIVEGPSELLFYSRVLSRLYPDKPTIQIISANGDTDQAERTINAIEKVFSPLRQSIYESKLVLLGDKPSSQRQAGVDEFIERYRAYHKRGQILFLPVGSLEEYYPPVKSWRKTMTESRSMNGKQKKQLAKRVGDEISREEFETTMLVSFDALRKCWEYAFE